MVRAKQSEPTESKAGKALLRLMEKDYNRMALKFRNAHAVAKVGRSFRDNVWLCKLDTVKGLDIGTQYINDKQAKTFVQSIADTQRQKTFTTINESSFISIAMDGSTDFTGEEMESLYVRTCTAGKISDVFLKIGSPENTSSACLHEFVLSIMDENGLREKFDARLVGMCTDGASNMLGHKSGLAALLKRTQPEIVVTHCLGHRVELAFRDAMKSKGEKVISDLYDRAITLLMGLYYHYKRSGKQNHALMVSFQALNCKPILPTLVGGTRWLSHLCRAIAAFLKAYPAVVAQLSTASQPPQSNAKAEGLAKLATDGRVLSFILILKVIYRTIEASVPTTAIWCCYKLISQWQCNNQKKAALPVVKRLATTSNHSYYSSHCHIMMHIFVSELCHHQFR